MAKKKKNNFNKDMEFEDIMSRNDKKKLKRFLFEEDNDEQKEEKDIDMINKKFDDELNKVKHNEKNNIEKKERQAKNTETKNIGPKVFSSISFILSCAYLIFTIVFCQNQVNNVYLIINASIITFMTLLFMITTMINRNIFSIFANITILLFLVFNFLVINNIIELPTQELLENFQNKTISEALKWAKENNIEVNQIYEYSDNIDEYHIITQDIYPNTLLKNVKEITFTVSYGPNYEKIISLPNMVGWNIDDAINTINNNFLNNVSIEYEINNEKEKDIILEQNISGQIRRNDELKLKVSLGSEDDLEPVDMIDLYNKSLLEATLWLKRHGIKYEIIYVFSDEVAKNYVADQETEVGTTIDPKNDKIKIIVSKGKKIVVPDLTKMTVDEVTEWIINNNLKVSFETKYNSTIEIGKIIEADYKENAEIEAGTLITITTSKGALKMPKFNNIADFRNWANDTGIEYREEYEFNNEVAKGEIIKTIPEKDAVINYSDTLVIYISYGKPVKIPSFIGKHKDEISSICSNIGLNCKFYYNGYSDTPVNIAQNQNKNANSEVVTGTYVSIGLSSGPAPVTPQPPSCNKNETTQIWITPGNDGNQTKSNILKAYPNIKWNFNLVDNCSNGDSGAGVVCNANEIDGKNLNHCDTYTVTIVK
ncbi:MAG: PASTA domain-containing protein [Bacilli bacterium]|nr:PASTA domain-containing protein [Bacilli bacterium]